MLRHRNSIFDEPVEKVVVRKSHNRELIASILMMIYLLIFFWWFVDLKNEI